MGTDAERFTALYRRHHPNVLAYALRRTDEARAHDVVAETFTAAWRHRAALREEALPWLYRTARNCLANEARSVRRQLRLADRLAGEAPRTISDHAEWVAEGMRLRSALAKLSERDGEALLLVSWEGLDHTEAAYVLGCSAVAFKVRLHRARKRLFRLLAADSASDGDRSARRPAGRPGERPHARPVRPPGTAAGTSTTGTTGTARTGRAVRTEETP